MIFAMGLCPWFFYDKVCYVEKIKIDEGLSD